MAKKTWYQQKKRGTNQIAGLAANRRERQTVFFQAGI
jgi:hypothetical protein